MIGLYLVECAFCLRLFCMTVQILPAADLPVHPADHQLGIQVECLLRSAGALSERMTSNNNSLLDGSLLQRQFEIQCNELDQALLRRQTLLERQSDPAWTAVTGISLDAPQLKQAR